MAKKWTQAADDAADKKAGIREGSPRDNRLDRARGLPVKGTGKKATKKRGT